MVGTASYSPASQPAEFPQPHRAMAVRVVSTIITSVIGAEVSLLVERAWRRRKEKRQSEDAKQPDQT